MTFDPIADFILSPPPIPAAERDMAATLLLDTLGVAAAAERLAPGRIAREHAVMFHGADRPENAARLLFDGRRASIPGAGFALASQIDNLDAHDGLNATKGHIGCAIVPALFAFAEAMPDLTAQEAITAMVVGYEVAARAAITLHATVSDYHTSGAWNAIGVAAMAAHLRGLDAGVLRHALGIAEYHGPRSQMMREIANPSMLHDGSGMGALVGSMATLMAARGFTGAPAITVEAAEAAPFWADLGRDWTITRNYIKPYPTCRWTHGALNALTALQRAHPFIAGDVAALEVASFTEATALYRGVPDTCERAQYSLPFPLAAMIVHGRLGPAQISGDGLRDPVVAALVARITVREEPRHSARFPAGRWADLTLTLTDGTVLRSGDHNARGGPEDPLPLAEVEEKFRLMTRALGPARATALWQMRAALDDPATRFSALCDLVYPAI